MCTGVCALGILPPLPPPTDGSVRPSAWSAPPRPKAARPQAHTERRDNPNPQYYFPRQAGRLRGDCVSAPPAHAPQRPPRRKFSFGVSPSPIPVGVAAARKEGSPEAQPSMGRLDSSIPLPCSQNFSSRERNPPGRGPSGQRVPCRERKERGAHLDAAHTGGSGPHARVRARGGSQRGWGRPERGPRAMPSGRAALGECGAAGQGCCRRRCCCLQCRLAED